MSKKWQLCWKAKGWGLGSVPLGASPGSVGSQSGHLNLWLPSLSVNFSHLPRLGRSVMLRMEIPKVSTLKKISRLPQPILFLSHGSVHTYRHMPYLSLNTSAGGALTTYKSALTIRQFIL